MKLHPACIMAFALLSIAPIGCEPPPAVENPAVEERVDVDVQTDRERVDEPNDAGVDVQVGGGEGVRVDVDSGESGTNVDVGGDGN